MTRRRKRAWWRLASVLEASRPVRFITENKTPNAHCWVSESARPMCRKIPTTPHGSELRIFGSPAMSPVAMRPSYPGSQLIKHTIIRNEEQSATSITAPSGTMRFMLYRMRRKDPNAQRH